MPRKNLVFEILFLGYKIYPVAPQPSYEASEFWTGSQDNGPKEIKRQIFSIYGDSFIMLLFLVSSYLITY